MIAFAFLGISCSSGGSDDDVQKPPTPSPTPTPDPILGDDNTVKFIGYLNAMSRATDTNFETGDRIGVFAVKASDGDTRGIIKNSGNEADNVAYTFNGSQFVPVGNGITKKNEDKYFYTAIYPYLSYAGATFDFTVMTDQQFSSNYTNSDLCTAYTAATDQKTVDLKFSHRLSRIIVNVTGDGWGGDDIRVIIRNALPTAAADVNNLTFTAKGSRCDLTFASNGTRSFKLILPPQKFDAGSNFIAISVNGSIHEIKAEAAQNLVSGKSYEYTVNMNKANPDEITFTGDINPWNSEDKIDDVLPIDIQDDIEPYIPIYKGNTPPNIEGVYFIDPFACVYCQDQGRGGFDPGHIVSSEYVRFSNQNMTYNTLDIDEVSANGNNTSSGKGAFISGTGNNFSAFFNTVGVSLGISNKTALVISGTKTQRGIANLRYAFVMVEKGPDPSHMLMDEGVFRVFKDDDEISLIATWPSKSPYRKMPSAPNAYKGKYSIYSFCR